MAVAESACPRRRDGGTASGILWPATLTPLDASGPAFDSVPDFENQGQTRLTPWEQLAQVLLSANEFMFVD